MPLPIAAASSCVATAGSRTLADLKGKTIAFADPISESGYLFPLDLFVQAGLIADAGAAETFFDRIFFAGGYQQAMQAMAEGAGRRRRRQPVRRSPAHPGSAAGHHLDRREPADSVASGDRPRRPGSGRDAALHHRHARAQRAWKPRTAEIPLRAGGDTSRPTRPRSTPCAPSHADMDCCNESAHTRNSHRPDRHRPPLPRPQGGCDDRARRTRPDRTRPARSSPSSGPRALASRRS